MNKQQLIEKYNNGELKVMASTNLTNLSGVSVCHVEYGIDDKVFGYVTNGEKRDFFFVKLKYLTDKIVFNVGKLRLDLNEFI
ncbi:hypothetical protein ABE137_12525 [Brevibacillus laterosporus]|uniref:hypothetical protein n=1 Tax=Brevibacillus phage Sundance TaxID=1691958 RepID=UPI0006BC1F8F|nr:hypothetical protein AVT09_gp188 [Brevibacillus phage Sundance]ALA48004.1 hypothetical protein SUNDANCE_188 [Brevibacillus phage Sundance]